MAEAATHIQTKEPEFLTEFDLHLFHEGTHSRLYEKLGPHLVNRSGMAGARFGLWAPNARSVSVAGDFNGWKPDANYLEPLAGSGVWTGFVAGARAGEAFQYRITSWHQGYSVNKADPMGFRQGEGARSFLWDLQYEWQDSAWMAQRQFLHQDEAPISIYQVHLGSWMRVPEEGNRILNFREIAPKLAEHVSGLGFTHVQIMPVMQRPADAAEYEVSGFFSTNPRYGAPQDLMYLIDFLHRKKIGVILDWPAARFGAGEDGLEYFDGTHLYEHGFWQVDVPSDGRGHVFDFARREVRSFLLSNAFFWLEKYHADGLRLDALPTMLYLDYGRRKGEWIPNPHGGRENLEAIDFLKQLNLEINRSSGQVTTIAEDRSGWPMLTVPVAAGGLGFGFKSDENFVEEILDYFGHDPFFRKFHHRHLTGHSDYAFTEKIVLPLSHETTGPPRPSLLAAMSGDEWQRFANLRLLLGFLWLQPGKKLLFMGTEFAQWQAWNPGASLDWHLCGYAPHRGVMQWVSDLNRVYRAEAALALSDTSAAGFEWEDEHNDEMSVLSWFRSDPDRREQILAVCNFTPLVRHNFRLGTRRSGFWREILNSDAKEYGGSGQGNFGGAHTSPLTWHERPHTLVVTLPPLGVVVFKHEGVSD